MISKTGYGTVVNGMVSTLLSIDLHMNIFTNINNNYDIFDIIYLIQHDLNVK